MSRWGKNIVVPLDSLCKEKENTNRPTVARSVGTVGKWGKMGFTSTRTYALAALPATLAAPSPGESPSSALDFDMSPSVPDPPKPKKFFKSVNTTTPEVMAQIIQHLPRVVPNSPTHDFQTHTSQSSPKVARAAADAIKIKIPKKVPTDRKKKPVAEKLPKPAKAAPLAPSTKSVASDEPMSDTSTENQSVRVVEVKCTSKKKKELKPEAAPSRVLGRARKTVNYCEEDYEERSIISSLKDIVLPKSTNEPSPMESLEKTSPIMSPSVGTTAGSNSLNIASKAPEHKPIVLRISKGTSRLVDTDNDDDVVTPSPPHNNSSSNISTDLAANSSGSYIEESATRPLDDTPQKLLDGTVDLPAPVAVPTLLGDFVDNANEINYSSVKISPDKPPKERLKLIIKGDVIRNAMAAAAASAAANKESINSIENSNINNNNSSSSSADIVKDNQQQQVLQRADKEKKKGKHKHKSKQLQPSATTLIPQICEFKAPSPNVISSSGHGHGNGEIILTPARTVTSPAVLSERDFDSQSSVLGSISSKGNSTPQLTVHASALPEECYVVHSRGSSVITSDLETSQHSSLVAPPSDIELRLESMMMDGSDTGGGVGGGVSQSSTRITVEEPLQEDILSVLRGDGDDDIVEPLTNGKTINEQPRGKRGRGRAANKREDVKEVEKMKTKRLRSKQVEPVEDDKTTALSPTPPPTTNRRGRAAKKFETINAKETLDKDLLAPSNTTAATITTTHIITPPPDTKETVSVVTRRGRPARSTRNNTCNYNNINNNNNSNNNNSNNSNINKIAANLCAKAEAQNIETTMTTTTSNPTVTSAASTQRSYGRKRKNQQVTQVLQPPTAEELEEQPNSAKMPAMSHDNYQKPTTVGTKIAPSTNNPNISYNNNSNNNSSSPPRHDYKVKDKFKRTIMLDNNPGSCDAVISMTNYEQQQQLHQQHDSGGEDLEQQQQQQQRASVKLVISKKKGSIFKSRTLVPADQNTEVSKRHLYKHRWDHDAGGDSTRDVGHDLDDKSASGNVNSKTANAACEIYDDINDNSHANVDGNGGNTCHVMETNATSGSGIGNSSSSNNNSSNNNNSASANSSYDMDIDELSRHSGSNASVDNGDACGGSNKRKDFYTVVRNVKTAHQIQEIGEYQEMNDDVQYILDALQPHNPMSTRILSAMQLASKCMSTAFRMHVRSHDVVTKFFKALSDANNNLSLGLCTSAVMYILSQEGLNMDLDRDSLELMMNLLEAENVADPAEYATYERNQLKIREFCEEIKAQGKATHLNVDTITVGTLAMETLLSLTSKRAGDWFKEELRELGGLEHIIKTITECCRPVIRLFEVMPAITWTGALLDSMRTVERCMRVMENVTQMNEENQKYILKYDNGAMVHTLATLYKLCERELLRHPTTEFTDKENTGVVLRELLMPLMKVLINLTHSFRKNSTPGAEVLGERIDVFDTSFQLLLKTSNYIPERLIFENNILVLLLLINLTMYSKINRTRVIQAQTSTPNHDGTQESTVSAVQAIMQYFYKCEELARLVEKNTDAMLDNTDKDKKKQEEVDETVNNLIQKAGHHMEHTLKGSYAGIFIGHIISDNEDNEMIVRRYLHGNGFKEIITVLEKYYTFMNLTASSDAFTVAHIKSTKELIDYYKRRDLIYAAIGDDNLPLNLDTSCSSTTYDTNMATTSSDAASARTGSQRVYKTYSSTR